MSMGSTDLLNYLAFMGTWESESDANIDPLIREQALFISLGDFNSDSVVDKEFDSLVDLACQVRDLTIAADALQISADAAAVASIWTFGFGMAAFAALEAAELIDRGVISSKSGDLNAKLQTVDTDIASQITPAVSDYISAYKANNSLIVSKAYKGFNTQECRSLLMQFMAEVQKKSGKLDAATFRQYAASARQAFNSQEISAVYDALDKLNFSNKTDADIQECMKSLAAFTSSEPLAVTLVQNFSIAMMTYNLNVANKVIQQAAKDAGIPVEEVDVTTFEAMGAVGKFITVVAVVMSVVDIVFQILNIVDVVKQCDSMCDKLNGDIRANYKAYFNGIKAASRQYAAAISGATPAQAA
ncbi:hypothetical protein [Pantoea allii]|uniref:hypothetical protein n=1 Tax=Pantoea allii TaxID=574096 RepID=UPI0024B7FAEA|nr:hypothetical protein [Pantoea allii]MDJ0040038.1 hypothetical protein [Pantoea allii]